MNERAISHLKAKDKHLAKVIDAVGELYAFLETEIPDCNHKYG